MSVKDYETALSIVVRICEDGDIQYLCDHAQELSESVKYIVGDILRQLAQANPEVYEEEVNLIKLRQAHEKHRRNNYIKATVEKYAV